MLDTTNASNTSAGAKSVTQWPSFRVTPPDPVLGKKEMSPEQTLIEFISTSAAFHGVKKQQIQTLEGDLLKVFPNNTMPANAAAWFMAKRKFYMNQPLDQQLLPFLLKKYPDKFQIKRNQVIFLEVYSQETAKRKLQYLVQYGMNAYFSHKADEFGVYFFDPIYYENTEPFHESLRQATRKPNAHRSKLVPEYFKQWNAQFKLEQHSPYLVSISKQPGVKVLTNTTGVIISMVNNQYGFIKFGSGQKALFCAKSLFKDGWQYTGDPLRLPAMQFDGYQIPGGSKGDQQYSWYAVLVWCGRKPSPKYCSTTADLNSTPVFRAEGGEGEVVVKGKKLRQPSSSMMIGQVIEIRRNSAVVSVRDDSEEKIYVPGWRHENTSRKGVWLTTVTGETVGLRDLVAYYVDTNTTKEGFHAVGRNVMVLKEYEEVKVDAPRGKKTRRRSSTMLSAGDEDYHRRVATAMLEQEEDSTDEFSEVDVDDSELEWLERDIESIIDTEPPEAKTIKLLVEVKSALIGVREKSGKSRGKGTPSPVPDSGVDSRGPTPKPPKPDREKYQPLSNKDQFWRLKAAMANLDEYESGEDEDYIPGMDIHQDPQSGHDSSLLSDASGFTAVEQRKRNRNISVTSGVTSDGEEVRNGAGPYWALELQKPMIWCPHTNKFLVLDIGYREERDPDYKVPEEDEEFDSDEEGEEEDLTLLQKESTEEIAQDLLDGKHRKETEAGTTVITPAKGPKIVITPVKDDKVDETANVKDESTADEGEDALKTDEAGDRIMESRLWVRELGLCEQDEDYESEVDPEWVPPTVIFDEDLDYDEVDESGKEIAEDELTGLKDDQKLPLDPGEALPTVVCGWQWCYGYQPTQTEESEKLEAEQKELPANGATDDSKKLGETIKKLDTHGDHRHCAVNKPITDETPAPPNEKVEKTDESLQEKNNEPTSKTNVTPKKKTRKTSEEETGKSPKPAEGKEVTPPEGIEKVEEKVEGKKDSKKEEKSEESGAKEADVVKKVSPNKKKGSGEKKRKGSKGKMAF